MFNLTVSTENAAFEEDWVSEIGRILRELGQRIEENGTVVAGGNVLDINGNVVGHWTKD